MNRTVLAALTAVGVLPLLACGPQMQDPPGELAASKLDRITTAAPQGDLDQAIANNTDFALALYRKLGAQGGNLVFSPHSITVALAMTYAGSAGVTQQAFETTLRQGLPAPRFHRAMNTLDLALESRGQGAVGKDGKPFRLNVENQLFSQKDYEFLSPFLDLLATEYGAGVRLVDFAGDAEQSRKDINDWIDNNTQHLIPELLAPGSVNPDTRLALVNTVYFNAAWEVPFRKENTSTGAFRKLDGSSKQVPLMRGSDLRGAHGVKNTVDVVRLRYDGEEVELVILAPPAGNAGAFAAFETSLTPAELNTLLNTAQGDSVSVVLPRFDFKTAVDLVEPLKTMGLGVAFLPNADFSGMRAERDLYVQGVVHQAVVKTDENGTEAAAATAVTMGTTSIPTYVELDRPFVFAIRDVATGALLFLGRVVDP